MQELSAAIKALNDASATFKSLGWMGVAILVAVLAFLLLKPLLARSRKATQEFNLSLAPPAPVQPSGGNGSGKVCPFHSGIEKQLEGIEKYQEQNSRQHGQLYDGLKQVAVNVASLTEAIKK
jgi:hypothetical protein